MLELINFLSNTYEAQLKELNADLAAERMKIKDLEEKIEIDPLVNILNRRGFERELNRLITHSSRYQTSAALVFIDLDNFKAINDRWGHSVGDRALQVVAGAIARSLRASDAVARIGGDEFAVLLWQISESNALQKARGIEDMLANIEILSADGSFTIGTIGASAGVATISPSDRANEIVERADAAMYFRKSHRGRELAA